MADNACFIFFSSASQSLESATQCLSKRGMTIKRQPDEIEVGFPGKPLLRIAFASDDYVRAEAEELSEGTSFSIEMSKCNARFEILIDDLDATLNEFNLLMDVQTALQELTHGYLYLTWNGNISGPD